MLTPTLQASGGTFDNEPNTVDDVVKIIATNPKGLTAAADYVGSAEQPPKGRSRQQTLKYSLPSSAKTINKWTLAVFCSLVGLMHGARGARLARVPDPPTWNPD